MTAQEWRGRHPPAPVLDDIDIVMAALTKDHGVEAFGVIGVDATLPEMLRFAQGILFHEAAILPKRQMHEKKSEDTGFDISDWQSGSKCVGKFGAISEE